MESIYLDHAASTPPSAEVRAAMRPWLDEEFGNPSSRHAPGARAAAALDQARARVARALAVRPEHVVFTSGGTEANNLGVLGALSLGALRRGARILIGATEHPSVRLAAQAAAELGARVETLELAPDGAFDLAALERRLDADVALVALMLANNEVGTVHPVREVARRVRARAPEARVHVDAVQAFGKLEAAPAELGCDTLALSGHKLHGPKGVGALVLARDLALRAQQVGGEQEGGRRAGTENVAGIVGLGRAVELAERERAETLAACARAKQALRRALAALPGARLLEPGSSSAAPLASIAPVFVPGPPAEVYVQHLAQRGVHVGAGSACQAARRQLGPAMLSLGLSTADARRVLRFSFARTTTEREVEAAVAALAEVARALEQVAP